MWLGVKMWKSSRFLPFCVKKLTDAGQDDLRILALARVRLGGMPCDINKHRTPRPSVLSFGDAEGKDGGVTCAQFEERGSAGDERRRAATVRTL